MLSETAVNGLELCENDEFVATVMFYEQENYCDRLLCTSCAIQFIIDGNNDDPFFDVHSAKAAIYSMVDEGSAEWLEATNTETYERHAK